jgi:Cytochrome c3
VKPLVLVALALAAGSLPAQETSCTTCHGDPDMFEGARAHIVADFAGSVHAEAGLSCHDCHGGNPSLELADDVEAMDPGYAPSPYVGAPDATQVPDFCARCHSDAAYMKRFHPDARSDQRALYATSQHGAALAAGDTRVATCVSCHGSHDVRRVSNPESRVYPTHVAETCSGCHSDGERMANYALEDGRPIPTDQYALWRHSVHARAMFDREDLSAPTCNDCHGNHGAAPPGLDSVALVCGQCHGREADLFRGSPKRAGFAEHNEFIQEAGEDLCAACHEPPEPQATLTSVHDFAECATCHGNHGILRPTMALLSPLPETPCAFCHEPFGATGATAIQLDRTAAHYASVRDGLLAEAVDQGLQGDFRFDWLVSQAEALPFHTVSGGAGSAAPQLRPEFSRLFEKFRIGRIVESYVDPLSGEPFSVHTVRCSQCHAAEPLAADAPVGLDTARGMIDRMRELTVLTASAERVILAARRGGVEVREGVEAIDQAVDSQIGLEVLVHGFSVADDSAFVATYDKGIEEAKKAIDSGRVAREELAFRRRGLGVALLIISVLLVALALKIRQLG